MLDLMNRPKYSVMIEDNQNNNVLVITSKSIGLVEILDEEIGHPVTILPPLIVLTKTGDHHHPGDPDLVDTGTQGVVGQGPVGTQDQQDVEEIHPRRNGGHDQRKGRTNIGPRGIEGGGIPSSPSKEQGTEQQAEEGNQTQTSQPIQAKAMDPRPPLPPPDTAPTSASSVSTVQTQGGAVSQPPAQQSQGHVAQAALTAATSYPMAKAVPLHQSHGHVQVAVQPDPRPMPTRQAQGQVQVMQPLPSPLYPPQQQLVAVQPRPQAQQLAAPPGLGTSQERNQAAHIQQMERELASLRAQLQATQAQAPSRQSSHSPDGWGWNQSQGGQWHGYGWHNWGDGRGYQ